MTTSTSSASPGKSTPSQKLATPSSSAPRASLEAARQLDGAAVDILRPHGLLAEHGLEALGGAPQLDVRGEEHERVAAQPAVQLDDRGHGRIAVGGRRLVAHAAARTPRGSSTNAPELAREVEGRRIHPFAHVELGPFGQPQALAHEAERAARGQRRRGEDDRGELGQQLAAHDLGDLDRRRDERGRLGPRAAAPVDVLARARVGQEAQVRVPVLPRAGDAGEVAREVVERGRLRAAREHRRGAAQQFLALAREVEQSLERLVRVAGHFLELAEAPARLVRAAGLAAGPRGSPRHVAKNARPASRAAGARPRSSSVTAASSARSGALRIVAAPEHDRIERRGLRGSSPRARSPATCASTVSSRARLCSTVACAVSTASR